MGQNGPFYKFREFAVIVLYLKAISFIIQKDNLMH